MANVELSVIIKSMDEPVVSQMRMEPGHANLNKIQKTSEEILCFICRDGETSGGAFHGGEERVSAA